MIEIEGLSKHYRDLTAIDDLSFRVNKGEIVGLLGPNGAGKSTTMKILTGFMPASSGTARIAGFDVAEQPMEVKRRLGYLPETPPIYPDLSVEEYLAFVAALRGIRRKERKKAILEAAERVHVAHVLPRLIRNLSKGFQQRVGLAQALIGSPEVLVLDEPTVGLDPRQIGEVRQLIGQLAGDHTIILSTHILQEVTATCQRAIIINRGRIVADDTLSALAQKHRRPERELSLEEIFLTLTEA